MSKKGFSTVLIHGEAHEGNAFNAHCTPIYATSTFSFDSVEQGGNIFVGEEKGYIYSRWSNPTIEALEDRLSDMECHGVSDAQGSPIKAKSKAFASGMGALTTLFLSLLKTGDMVISSGALYGGTSELLDKMLPKYGMKRVVLDLNDLASIEETLTKFPQVKVIFMETPSNPTLCCYDIQAISNLAKKYDVKVAVDNTFATPYLQQPFRWGADFIMHSTTKYLNGHGSSIGGIILGKNVEFMNTEFFETFKLVGANTSAFDAWLVLQGLKTLEVRMDRHCRNARKLAHYLLDHPAVAKVTYPGFEDHPHYELATRQMKNYGGLISFELKAGFDGAVAALNKVKVCTLAVSLGGVDTLIQHPASMTHASVDPEVKEKAGINERLIRISVGMENIEDLMEDLDQAIS
ncbi:MAG: methionine-gamma-lyase [Sphingobacteriales bacterium]|jgi:methionine-gamma-lyase